MNDDRYEITGIVTANLSGLVLVGRGAKPVVHDGRWHRPPEMAEQ